MYLDEYEAVKSEVKKLFDSLTYEEQKEIIELLKAKIRESQK